MNKRHARYEWTRFRAVKPQYLLILAVLSAIMSVGALRSNNQHMATLRSALYAADKNNGNVQADLNALQAYVTAHMNTSLTTGNAAVYPPIQLQYTYERLVQKQANDIQAVNGDLYTKAQVYCQAQDSTDFSGHNRVPCIEQYVQAHGVKVPAIPPSLYEFSFVSPKWSPDLAGWSLAATIVLSLATIIKFLVDRHLKKLLN